MSTETQTTTQQQQHIPELTIIQRMASIPLISCSLETINVALTSNVLTRQPYTTAKGLSCTAYQYTEPLQIRLAPLIERADGYANKAVTAIESRYPYPFKAKPEEVVSLVRERRQSAIDVANKAIDDKIKSPAFNMAQGIDQQFAPIVDYFEVAVTRLNSEAGSPHPRPETKYQYQRAIALSKTLKDQLYEYSNEQLKQLQAQSVILQRAMDTAQAITQLASSSISSAQKRVHELSDTMLQELQKLQSSTASLSASLQSTASSTLHESTSHIQHAYHDVSSHLSSTVSELSSIVTDKNLPLPEKVSRVGREVQEKISPLLEAFRKSLTEVLARGKEEAHSATNGAEPRSNGHSQEK
jgi:hypothetical protein